MKLMRHLSRYWAALTQGDNRWLLLAGVIFLLIQLFYSYLLWQRTGNAPPTPGDSYNYIIKIHQLAVGEQFLAGSNEMVNATFNFLYGLTAKLFGLSPTTVYQLFFFMGKAILMYALLYLLTGLTKNKKIVALSLLSLAFFSGTGDVHGFFWVAPSFWMLVVFFLLLGAIVRGISVLVLLPLSLALTFTHPVAVYTVVPVAGFALLLHFMKEKPLARRAAIGAAVLFVAALLHQGFIMRRNESTLIGQLVNALDIARSGIAADVDPDGYIRSRKIRPDEKVPVGLLTWRDIAAKLRGETPTTTTVQKFILPGWLLLAFPAIGSWWNGYLFYWALSPWLTPVVLLLMAWLAWRMVRRRSFIAPLFLSFLAASLAATIHPQGHRLAIFLWPLTFVFGSEVVAMYWQRWSRNLRMVAAAGLALFLVGHLAFSVVSLRRIAQFQNFSWDTSCVNTLLAVTSREQPILYSSGELAITAFAAYGGYQRTAFDLGYWDEYFKTEPIERVVYVVYNTDAYYADPVKRAALRDQIAERTDKRQRTLEATNCGDVSILREKER